MTRNAEVNVEALLELEPMERIARAGELIEEYRQAMAATAQVRSEAVAELKASGMAVAEIARHLKLSRQQVNRIKNASDEAETQERVSS